MPCVFTQAHIVRRLRTMSSDEGCLRRTTALREASRGVLARYLRVNTRTLENWEQGRAQPNAQAALLIRLVRQYPDTIERLASV